MGVLKHFSFASNSALRQLTLLRKGKGAGLSIVTLMSGTAAGQAITLIAAPILTRLYSPDNFGILAVCVTVVLLSGPVNSVRYELAIVPADNEDDALGLFILACTIAVMVGVLIGLFFQLQGMLPLLKMTIVRPYAWIVSLGITVSGIVQASQQYAIRSQNYRRLSASQLIQSSVSVSAQVNSAELLGLSGPLGLLLGYLFGLLAAAVTLTTGIASNCRIWLIRHRGHVFRSIWSIAKRYHHYPRFLPWGGFLDVVAQKLPVLLLPMFYGAHFLGLYAIADRMLRTPLSLVGQAAAPVLFKKMTDERVKSRLTQVLFTWGVLTTICCLMPFAALVYFGRPLFAFVLGKQWLAAGSIAAVLVPVYWGALVVSPVSTLLIVANRQGLLVAIQALFLATGFLALWGGHLLFHSGTHTMLLYSLAQFCVYLIYFGTLLSVANSLTNAKPVEVTTCAE